MADERRTSPTEDVQRLYEEAEKRTAQAFEEAVTAAGGQVHWARDAAQARAIILDILHKHGAHTVLKGKSMVSEEIALNPHLEANGIATVIMTAMTLIATSRTAISVPCGKRDSRRYCHSPSHARAPVHENALEIP